MIEEQTRGELEGLTSRKMSQGLFEEDNYKVEEFTKILLIKKKLFFHCLRIISKINFELFTDKNASEYDEECKISEKGKREWKNEALTVVMVASIYRICTSVAPTLPSSAV